MVFSICVGMKNLLHKQTQFVLIKIDSCKKLVCCPNNNFASVYHRLRSWWAHWWYGNIGAPCRPKGGLERAVCIPAHGAVIGAWVGAFPMPLDWERPWQVNVIFLKIISTFLYSYKTCSLLCREQTSVVEIQLNFHGVKEVQFQTCGDLELCLMIFHVW